MDIRWLEGVTQVSQNSFKNAFVISKGSVGKMSGKWNNPHLEALPLQGPVVFVRFLAQSEKFENDDLQIFHFELKNAKKAPIFKLIHSGVIFC